MAYKKHSLNGRVCIFLVTHLHKYRSMGDEKEWTEVYRVEYKTEPSTSIVTIKPSCGATNNGVMA